MREYRSQRQPIGSDRQRRSEMANRRKNIVKLIIIIAGILILVLWFHRHVYEYSYFKKLGIPDLVAYEKLLEIKGAPIREYEDQDGQLVVEYEGVAFAYTSCGPRADIFGDRYRFGRKKVGVGSTREEVEDAYKGIRIISDVSSNEFGVIDGWQYEFESRPWILYTFDENNVVGKISVYYGP